MFSRFLNFIPSILFLFFASNHLLANTATLATQSFLSPTNTYPKIVENATPQGKYFQEEQSFEDFELYDWWYPLLFEKLQKLQDLLLYFQSSNNIFSPLSFFKIKKSPSLLWNCHNQHELFQIISQNYPFFFGQLSFTVSSKFCNLDMTFALTFEKNRHLLSSNILSTSESQMFFFFDLVIHLFQFQHNHDEDPIFSLRPIYRASDYISPDVEIKTVDDTGDMSLAENYLKKNISQDEQNNFVSSLAFILSAQYCERNGQKPEALSNLIYNYHPQILTILEIHIRNILHLSKILSKKLTKPVKFYIYIFTGNKTKSTILHWLVSKGFLNHYVRVYSHTSLPLQLIESPQKLSRLFFKIGEQNFHTQNFSTYQENYENFMKSRGITYNHFVPSRITRENQANRSYKTAISSGIKMGVFREMKDHGIKYVQQFNLNNIWAIPKTKSLLNTILESEKEKERSSVVFEVTHPISNNYREERGVFFFKNNSNGKFFYKKPFAFDKNATANTGISEYIDLGNCLYNLETVELENSTSSYISNIDSSLSISENFSIIHKEKHTEDLSLLFTETNHPIFLKSPAFVAKKLRTAINIQLNLNDFFSQDIPQSSFKTTFSYETLIQIFPNIDPNCFNSEKIRDKFKEFFGTHLTKFLRSDNPLLPVYLVAPQQYKIPPALQEDNSLDKIFPHVVFAKLQALKVALKIRPNLNYKIFFIVNSKDELDPIIKNVSKYIDLDNLKIDFSIDKKPELEKNASPYFNHAKTSA